MHSVSDARRVCAVLLATTVLLSTSLGVVFAGTALAAVGTSERTIATTGVEPGEPVSVTLDVTVSSSGERLQISDNFSPVFNETSVVAVEYNGNGVIPVGAIGQPGFVEVALERQFQAGDTVSVTYQVTVPPTAASGTTFEFDGFAALDNTAPVTHTGETTLSVNAAPTADAGADQSVAENTGVELNASASSDPDGDALSFAWTQTAGPAVALADNDTATPTFTAPEVDANTTLSFAVTVADATGRTDADVANVTVEQVNKPPVADAGADQSVPENTGVELNASASSDPDGDALSFAWTQTDGPTVALANNDTATPTFTSPEVTAATTLSFTVTVNDGNGGTDTDVTNVTVGQVNKPPVADAGADQSVAENTEVELDASASSDPDGDALSFAWTQTAGPAVALADNDTATPTFTAPEVDANTTLSFAVTVADGNGGADTDVVNVTVEQVNKPPVADAGADQSVDEGALVQLDASNTGDPDDDIVTFVWAQTGGPPVGLTDNLTATPTFTAPDVATLTTLSFTVTVNDGNGGTDTDVVNVSVAPTNDPPVADAGADQTVAAADVVELNGSASSDPNGDSLSYAWTQVGGPSIVLVGNDTATPTFVAPTLATTTMVAVQLTVADGNGGIDTDVVNVTILLPAAPQNFSVSDLSAPQNVTAGETVTVSANVTNVGGTGATQSVAFRFDFDADGTLAPDEEVLNQSVTLQPGATTTVSFDVPTTGVAPGTYRHGVFTANDSLTAELTVEPDTEAGSAFFAVTALSVPSSVEPGDTVTVSATVNNTGTVAGEQTIEARVDLDRDGTLDPVANDTATLEAGESTTFEAVLTVPADTAPGPVDVGVFTDDDENTTTVTVESTTPPVSGPLSTTLVCTDEGGSLTVTNVGESTVQVRDIDGEGMDVVEGRPELAPGESMTLDGLADGTVVLQAYDPETAEPVGPEIERTVDCGAEPVAGPLSTTLVCTDEGGSLTVTNVGESPVQMRDIDGEGMDVVEGRPELAPDESMTLDGLADGTVVLQAYDPETAEPVGPEVERTVDCSGGTG